MFFEDEVRSKVFLSVKTTTGFHHGCKYKRDIQQSMEKIQLLLSGVKRALRTILRAPAAPCHIIFRTQ